MLNYNNLNDVEFENLCQDIMSEKLGINLRHFAPGKDGGIDLKALEKNIIVQVKHYMNSSVSSLLSSLRKEVANVKENNPKEYYVCCSKVLSPDKEMEIYNMFSNYMESEANIITLNEIEDFLIAEENVDILRKNFKLWISSTNILEDLYNSNIFIDCEVLLADIKTYEKYFVQTAVFDESIQCLSKQHVLFLLGNPGVGKTITSKILVLYYASIGYRVRFSTDVTDISTLKRALVKDKAAKEVILLDDCLGQAYFEMKTTQGNELLSLIKYVNASKNKLLILNSRITIYKEAKRKTPELVKSFENKEFKVRVIDMSEISYLDKAKILYNHLYFNTREKKYFEAIKKEKRYIKIVTHKNYYPRIIEFITNPNRYAGIKTEEYYSFIMECLQKPKMIWDNEYEERLRLPDRCLLLTIYSLTNTYISWDMAQKCFIERVKNANSIDTTVNQFEQSLKRLHGSFINIVDIDGERTISMINPSINDYLECKLKSNPLEISNILKTAKTITQIGRLLSKQEAEKKIMNCFESGEVKGFYFESEDDKNYYIANYVISNSLFNKIYKENIFLYLEFIIIRCQKVGKFGHIDWLLKLFTDDVYYYYDLTEFFRDTTSVKKILSILSLKDLPKLYMWIYEYFKDYEGFSDMFVDTLDHAIDYYCDTVDVEEYDIDIDTYVYDNKKLVQVSEYDYEEEVDTDRISSLINDEIVQEVEEEIDEVIKEFPYEFQVIYERKEYLDISIFGIDDLVENAVTNHYYDPDDAYDAYRDGLLNSPNYEREIDLIFER